MSNTGWTIASARTTYRTKVWGEGYVDIAPDGRVIIGRNLRPDHPGIALESIPRAARDYDLQLPLLCRFQDILDDRVRRLCDAFAGARDEMGYTGGYTAVYPIKVNQQRSVVERILEHGDRVGLEAGSKPELIAVLALARQPDGLIVCNGYKDREYIRLALIGRALGHPVYLVIEKPSELDRIAAVAEELGIEPLLGLRIRLASLGTGNWQNTGGEKSKFGLSAAQAQAAVERLRATGRLHWLRMLHFHMGSQIANIRAIQNGLREAARYYSEFCQLGAPMGIVDVGGGLGIDYEGTRSRGDCSINYGLREYANNVVRTFREVCAEQDLPHPHLITEAGRAMAAHHAVLITSVIDTEVIEPSEPALPLSSEAPAILHNLRALTEDDPELSATERYHDAAYWLAEAQDLYTYGVLSLEQRALAEQLYIHTCARVRQWLETHPRQAPAIQQELNEKLADKYFCNFSVFQSTPDVWGIDQVFPILPLSRLNERPERRAVVGDLTCDSDGQIQAYVGPDGIEPTLPVHALTDDTPYLLGIFLVGAYQEILGDLHNLFGDTDSINIELTADGGYHLNQPEQGDTIDALLRYVHFDPERIHSAFAAKLEAAGLSPQQRDRCTEILANGLSGYTYLED